MAAVEMLLAAGADAAGGTDQEVTPLHGALEPEIIRALVAAGADVNAETPFDTTPLYIAARANFNDGPEALAAVEALLAAGADVNAAGDGSGKYCVT